MRFLSALFIFGATAAGYVYQHGELTKESLFSDWITTEGAVDGGDKPGRAGGGMDRDDGPPIDAAETSLASAPESEVVAVEGPPVADFAEVFRFDANPRMITRRWSRVSAGLSDPHLQGYRVPLVTGTSEADLAGSLTYYFDTRPRVRRIAFLGTTGDPDRIVEFVIRQFGFRRIPSRDPRRTLFGSRLSYRGQLQIDPAGVFDRKRATSNYRVKLTVER